MLSRGFSGAMPDLDKRHTTTVEWSSAAMVVAAYVMVAVVALALSR
jgi:hypothetical protein